MTYSYIRLGGVQNRQFTNEFKLTPTLPSSLMKGGRTGHTLTVVGSIVLIGL